MSALTATYVSKLFHVDPVTVSIVPVGPVVAGARGDPVLSRSEGTPTPVMPNTADANGVHVRSASQTKTTYDPMGRPLLTVNTPATVPSGPWPHETGGVSLTGVPVIRQVAPVGLVVPPLKPEPETVTDVPDDPVLGVRTILGTTVNEAVFVSAGVTVDVTVTV